MKTWHYEAAVQGLLYGGLVLAMRGTLFTPDTALSVALWHLGRLDSRQDRQREAWAQTGVLSEMVRHEVECMRSAGRDLRLARFAFGCFGLAVGSYLTLVDLAWGIAYPLWRRWYRGGR